MSDAEALLAQATEVLERGGGYGNRAACWIARAALESALDDHLQAKNHGADRATMRSKLTILHVALGSDSQTASKAEYAWSRLSWACHHHAFQLSPGVTEVRDLIDLVAAIEERTHNSGEKGHGQAPRQVKS